MIDRDKKSDSERDRQGSVPNDKSIIPGKHGRHGGSPESEGAPQEPTPEAPTQSNGADQRRH